ncbi:hypothetical protein [Aquimarina agarivorans]|uniref:hypothetical protein n=1 Tax=Aquimarina agarivorans TaxID=980584 RepID=UPI000248E72F|nr:hypothetical protein [Aquimarina agarivorans]
MDSLLFVYKASSDFWSKKIDLAHKILSPNTYACSLCALTHGNFGETDNWKSFSASAKLPMEFIYKDEFEKRFLNKNITYPVIFSMNKGKTKLVEVISSDALAKLNTVEELIFKLQSI